MRALIITVWLIGAAVSGGALYGIAYEVERMDAELAALEDEIREEREATHGLRAEWAYLARPARIETLSQQHLPRMRNLAADRIGATEDVPYLPLPDVLDVLEPEDLATPASMRAVQ